MIAKEMFKALLTFAVAALGAQASTFSSATVMTSSVGGQNPCSLNSPGSQILCMSPNGGSALAMASATETSASVTASVATNPVFGSSQSASATAGFDTWIVVIGGVGGGTLLGHYYLTTSSDGGLSLSIWQSGMEDQTAQTGFGDNLNLYPASVPSAFLYGVPFEVKVSLAATANLPGDYENASVQFVGVSDAAGAPLDFTFVPEPVSPLLFILGGGAGFLVWLRNRVLVGHETAKKRFPQSRHL